MGGELELISKGAMNKLVRNRQVEILTSHAQIM